MIARGTGFLDQLAFHWTRFWIDLIDDDYTGPEEVCIGFQYPGSGAIDDNYMFVSVTTYKVAEIVVFANVDRGSRRTAKCVDYPLSDKAFPTKHKNWGLHTHLMRSLDQMDRSHDRFGRRIHFWRRIVHNSPSVKHAGQYARKRRPFRANSISNVFSTDPEVS
jgi:hypothetical protein